MQITLNEKEIKKAIVAYVGNQGISIAGRSVEVSLTAGRSPNGMSASIEIANDGDYQTSVPSPCSDENVTIHPAVEPEEDPDEDKDSTTLFGN